MTVDDDHYFVALGSGAYRPTMHVQGAWSPKEQHVAPVIGLLLHCLEREHPREDLQWSRLSVDILGMIHLTETTVATRVLRAGRTIELLEATATAAGRAVVRLTAWRLAHSDTRSVSQAEAPELPSPTSLEPWQGMGQWGGGFIRSLEFRAVPDGRPGRRQAWIRSNHPLVAGEDYSPLAAWVGLLDTANGIATRHPPGEWLFPNVDLTLHLHRTPSGPWVGLDTAVSWGPTGLGQTSSVVHDVHGPVGTVEQALTVRSHPQG
ncbi:MAG: thioesterase family protein [Ornithinimicrobium sp.]|uniref:thioesterase family protein n=1 Tax=Ornithinimicrobium sp. TaxID=1977084 RepID=UPI0026DF8E34|nr:thioesterase family protein [Ornithinimicrobium sp.]MDO5740600.1 thioesterase family protein [Ornithinimicrobium sp.]